MKTNQITTDEVCSFCGRGNGKVDMLIQSKMTNVATGEQSDARVCKDCSMNLFFTFVRIGELQVKAQQLSAEAVEKYGKQDSNGDCTCPNCLFPRLMEMDPIMQAIEKAAQSFRAEEVTTNHSGTNTVQ